MKSNKGFTLIEMLVVIAVIGILSAAVLTALGPSRNKAKDSTIISGVQQVRATAEAHYTNDYSWLPTGTIDTSDSKLGAVAKNISDNSGSLVINATGTTPSAYAAYSKLASDPSKYYCVDSTGNTQTLSSTPSGSSCQ